MLLSNASIIIYMVTQEYIISSRITNINLYIQYSYKK